MLEILSMSYWRFNSILKSIEEQDKVNSGKPIVQQGLYQSQKDMIARTKEFEERQAKKKLG